MIILDSICTLSHPEFNEVGEIIWTEIGDFFCKIVPGADDRYLPGFKTHVANMEFNGVQPGCRLKTSHGTFLVVSVDKTKNNLGLIFQQ